jgi:alpha-1,6-mannosyltransferase
MAAPSGLAAPYLHIGRLRAAIAHGAVASVVVSGVAIAVLSGAQPAPIIRGARHGLPHWITGVFSGLFPQHMTLNGFYLLVGAMGVAYLTAIALGAELRAKWVVGSVVLLHAAFLLAPPLLSTDVFNYIDYARLGSLHGLDPYIHGPVAASHDPVFAYTAWRHIGSAYGPLFTIASYPLAHVGVAAALWSFKAVAALASLGCVALVWRIARQLGQQPARAAAIFGLNPLLLVWTVGGAHNDLLMLVLMLAGVSLALARREALGGAAIVAAAAVKATAGLALPFLLLGAGRARWRALAGAAAAAVVVYAMSAIAFPGHPLGVISVLSQQHVLVGYNSVPKELALLFGLPGVTSGVRTLVTVALVVALGWLVVRVWRGAEWVAACGWAMVAVVVTATWFLAWYAVWPLAFAAVSRDRRLLVATLGLEAFFIANHIPNFTH